MFRPWWFINKVTAGSSGPTIPVTANLFLHFDAVQACDGKADGDSLTTWEDISGNARHLSQLDAAVPPTCQTGISDLANGNPVVRFDATAPQKLMLADNTFVGVTAATFFIVVKKVADPSVSSARSGSWNWGQSNFAPHFPFTDGNIYEGFGTTARKTVGNPAAAMTSWRVYSVVSAPSDYRAYLDLDQLFNSSFNTVAFNTTDITFGKSNGGGFFLDADVGEIIVYDAALSTVDRELVRDYLITKWGV